MTHLDHLPPEKISGAFWTREGCQALAMRSAQRPCTSWRRCWPILSSIASPGDPGAQAARAGGHTRLEAACARALYFGDLTYQTLASSIVAWRPRASHPHRSHRPQRLSGPPQSSG